MTKVVEAPRYKEGDLVKLTRHSYQNGIVYRVVACEQEMGWSVNGHRQPVHRYKLKPVVVLINAAPDAPRHHTTQLENQLAPVDLLELGRTFSDLETLIKHEVARLSGEKT